MNVKDAGMWVALITAVLLGEFLFDGFEGEAVP